MKRFRECNINCTQGIEPRTVLDEIESICKSAGIKTERYKTWEDNDSMKVKYEKSDLPSSYVIIACPEGENKVSICNIVPSEENTNQRILLDDYNSILNVFVEEIIKKITSVGADAIMVTSANYELRDVIPFSYESLSNWLAAFPLSGHQKDEERWYDFVISIVKNSEYLPCNVLAEYLKENQSWDNETIEELMRKFEYQRDILRYFLTK